MIARLQSVRLRTTIGASVVVAIALLIAGLLLLELLRSSQLDSIDSSLELRSLDIAALLEDGNAPDTIAIKSDEDGFVQILDDAGSVIAASENVAGEGPMIVAPPETTRTQRIGNIDNAEFRVHVHETDGAARRTILVGINLEEVDKTVGFVGRALLFGLPALLIVMAIMIWLVVGRALHPVEAIRAQVADIGGRDLDRRVPEPAARDEVGRLAVTMNAMLDRLEQSNTRQARFVSDASHELRTPIAIIRHELEIALRGDGSDWREVAEDLLEEDLRMQRLVDDLLLLARRDNARVAVEIATLPLIDLDDVVLGEAHRVRTNKIVRTAAVSAGQIRGDNDQIARIVRNLIDNALHHADSTIELHLDSANGEVRLDVDDDGDGVDDVDRQLIFERFSRPDQSRARADGGAGLGLAIVAELVADHEGVVTVERSPHLGGARFSVTFPDARAER